MSTPPPVIDVHAGSDWPLDGIEIAGACPLCGSHARAPLHGALRDRLFGAPGTWTLQRCESCRLGYLDPRPNRATVGLAYASYITHDALRPVGHGKTLRSSIRDGYLTHVYGYRHLHGPRWGAWLMRVLPAPFRREWDHWARHLKPPTASGATLLDVGCGNGRFLADARGAGWEVHGIEPDPAAAQVARSAGLAVTIGSFDDVSFPDGSFDVITANQVIEHLHDPHAFVASIGRWLKPGGHIWIGTPNLDCPIHARYGRDYGNLHPPQHLVMFNPDTLRRLFSDHSFVDVKFLKRGFHDYSQTLSSAALARGEEGAAVYRGVRNAPWRDRAIGTLNELRAWANTSACSDLVMVARTAS